MVKKRARPSRPGFLNSLKEAIFQRKKSSLVKMGIMSISASS